MFNFERDHAEIDEELEEPNESGYVREFYMRFTTRGIYPADLQGKSHFRTIEEDLNAKITLKEIVANTILNSNNENYIKYAIDNAPIDTYHTFLKCAIYTLNDFAVQYLVEHWPFESLELIRYFQDAYSSLLMFYCTDISSYTGRIASQVHKWILIGDKYVKMVTKIFIRQRHKEGVKLCKLDISGLPVSARLFTKLVDIYYKHVYNHESLFKQPNILQKTNDEKEKADEAPRMSKAAAAAVAAAASAISALAAAKRRKKNSEDEDEDENMTSSGDSGQNRDNSSDDVKDDDEDEDEDEDDDENNRDEFINCIRKTFFNDVDESDESSDIEENEDEDEDQDESESLESESEFESDSDANSLPSLENISDVEMKEESSDKKDDKKEKAVNKASNDNEKEESGEKNSPKKKNGGEKRLFNIKSPKIIIRAPRVFKPNTVKQTIRLDFEETYSCDFARFAGCIDYMNKVNLNPDELMFNLNIARLNMTIQNAAEYQIKPSFERVAKRVIGLSLFFMARPVEIKHTFSIIKHFPNITELNVSAFGSEQQLKTAIAQNPSIRDELYESLSSLVHLKRLRLNALEITGHVRRLLGSLKLPLEYLNLTSCRLDPDDLEYLAESSHASSVRVLILSNDDLEKNVPLVKNLLVKCSRNLEVLDMGCNTFSYEDYMTLIWEISKMPRLKMLVTLNLFTFDNYLKIADKLNEARSFMAWRLNFSTDYYQQSVKIRSKFKFKKFKSDYLKSLQNKFDSRPVKITINDPDLNFILHEVL